MPVSLSFRTFIVDQLSRIAPRVRARSMFGGVGIYSGDLFFALIADDALYFKVDDSNRGDFEARVVFRQGGTILYNRLHRFTFVTGVALAGTDCRSLPLRRRAGPAA